MRYVTTRSGAGAGTFTFGQALLSGYAPDGGLFVPESLPRFSRSEIKEWAGLTYPQLMEKFLGIFTSPEEITPQEISELLDGGFASFNHPDVIPVTKTGSLYFADTWHGPTGAYKDLVLLTVARLANHYLSKKGQKASVIIATAGDTGAAAIHAMKNSEMINVMVLYPLGRITRVQELSMTTAVDAPNVTLFSFEGHVDEPLPLIQRLFADEEFRTKYQVMFLNSVNIARVIVQSVHYFYSYLRVCPTVDRDVIFSVPCGALGNLTGAYIAREMGLPIQLLGATNENDIVHRAFHGGKYALAQTIHATFACAMDVEVPYNIERLFYFMSGANHTTVREMMEGFEKTGQCAIPDSIFEKMKDITTAVVTQDKIVSTIKEMWRDFSLPLCPHTATATHLALDYLSGRIQLRKMADSQTKEVIVLATATAAKFPEVLEKAGVPLPHVPAIDEFFRKAPGKIRHLKKEDNWEAIVRETIEKKYK